MQSNADRTLELDRAEPSRAEPVGGEKCEEEEEEEEEMKEKRGDAKVPGEWELVEQIPAAHQDPSRGDERGAAEVRSDKSPY